jgi:hypothetical protein
MFGRSTSDTMPDLEDDPEADTFDIKHDEDESDESESEDSPSSAARLKSRWMLQSKTSSTFLKSLVLLAIHR